jgi:pimeloyl-ACP methyl ester carboxylesterase
VLLLHGNAGERRNVVRLGSTLARHFRVVRARHAGFARSTPMPRDYKWTLDRVIDDFVVLMDQLKIERFTSLAQRSRARSAAASPRFPERVQT